jgi:hypothetical protein
MKLKKASDLRYSTTIPNLESELDRIADEIEQVKRLQNFLMWGSRDKLLHPVVVKKLKDMEYHVSISHYLDDGSPVYRISW